jgi:membrane-bound lytic murein transglycosylase B
MAEFSRTPHRRGLLASGFALAIGWLPSLALASYLQTPDAQAFAARMQSEHGFEKEELQDWLASAEKQQKIIDAISRPSEKMLEWKSYRNIFLTADRIADGRTFLRQHRETFERAESDPGLSRYVAAAILGVETRYGRYRGAYRVIDALATLAFDYPPRADFFRKELEQFLLLAREQGFDPLKLEGSYAGAMGYGQFISSSYRAYAIDFDGDGVADILDNPTDAIGSVANYFARHGWKPGQPVAERVAVEPSQARMADNPLKPTRTLGAFRAAGVQVGAALPDTAPARLLRLEGEAGVEYWLTYHNFYVITRYNHSSLYAMAVLQLSREIENTAAQQLASKPAARE